MPAAEQADAIIVRWFDVTPQVISRWRRCRIIVRYGVGYDNVHYEAATAAGIMIGHCPHYCLDEVATHALALLLGCVRGIRGTHARLAAGDWDQNTVVPRRPDGRPNSRDRRAGEHRQHLGPQAGGLGHALAGRGPVHRA